MRKAAARHYEISLSAKSVTRFLMVAYFTGLGFGLVQGAQVEILLQPLMPHHAAEIFSAVLIVCLALLVLVRKAPRIPALLLGLVVFWASYLTMMMHSGPQHMADFWRDLALVGILLLSCDPSPQSARIDVVQAFSAAGHRVRALLPSVRSSNAGAALPSGQSRENTARLASTPHPRRVRSELYRQDFEVARAP